MSIGTGHALTDRYVGAERAIRCTTIVSVVVLAVIAPEGQRLPRRAAASLSRRRKAGVYLPRVFAVSVFGYFLD